MHAAAMGQVPDELKAGTWLHENPHRLNLGRIGLRLRRSATAPVETDPTALADPTQTLDLWRGIVTSDFLYADAPVRVTTVAEPESSVVAFRIESTLLADQRAQVEVEFPYASTGFFQSSDWAATDRHESHLDVHGHEATIRRHVDATEYDVGIAATTGAAIEPGDRPHLFLISAHPDHHAPHLEVVVSFAPAAIPKATLPSFTTVAACAEKAWEHFWLSGAALDFSDTNDPRAAELERRAVLSQYLTRVNSAGILPPQETGLTTNSWQGKFHLEMHPWHAAHFATWGRPELLERSLPWYETVLDVARATAARQGYSGARWPKQAGPDGRESPTPIGSLLAWQQPHILYMLELVWRASVEPHRSELLARFADLVAETATFMSAFADEHEGSYHLGPPIMPAQEFYDATLTQDPTFELAYWWWGLEIAQRWRERSGLDRNDEWTLVQNHLAQPLQVDGLYRAVRDPGPLRRDDHPSATAALGLVPATPLIEANVMAATLADILNDWEWPSAWGWDFPMMAMTATRLGRPDLAVQILLRDERRNAFTAVGHNPQLGAALPLYLPGNGALLAALSLLAAGGDDGTPAGFPKGWTVRAEGFIPWP
ncbi:hypothetical protein [Microbacterium sp. P02]|uniref:hypothetical protein n=1 Tax=Microbacterium sp. P02 TaxID=3366260 RepID=UPI00366F7F93